MPDFSSPFTTHQPPRLSRNEAKARTAIAQRGSGLVLHLGNAPWRVDLHPDSPEPMAPGDWLLSFEWVGAEFHLQLPHAIANQVAGSLMPGASLAELPHELASAVLEAALTDTLSVLNTLGRGMPQWLGMQKDGVVPGDSANTLGVHLRTEDDSAAIKASLHTDSLGLLLVAGLLGKRAPVPGALNDHLVLKLAAEIGFTHLPSHELGALAQGDVVLMDGCHLGAQRMLWLSADGAAGLQVHLPAPPAQDDTPPEADALHSDNEPLSAVPPQLIVTQAWSSTMPAEMPPSANVNSIDGVPVRLSFDLGDVTLTVAEARALQPGQAISLARPLSGAVTIRANGARVGEGDLVEIDGQLGVSIRTLFASSQQEVE
ncbi:type III secretion system cytoplasmic ring protein SctQ [Ottowia thiooxydans]|uniref:Type III secretion protein Q n=1 Tax=Ottowia thiooxydans TaxID=219182 RepID=A0ABV2QGD4_9BURK